MSELSAGLYLAALIIIGLVVWQLIRRGNLVIITLLAVLLAFLIHQSWQQVPEMAQAESDRSSETIMSIPAPAPIIVTATAVPLAVPHATSGGAANWLQVPAAVARWQPNILEAVLHCDVQQVMDSYDAGLLMAAIVMQESSGDPNAIGKAHDTGLAQVVPNEHPDPMFKNRPSQAQLLEPQFNLNYAACLLRDNIKRTGSVRRGLTAYNGSPPILSTFTATTPALQPPQRAFRRFRWFRQ